MKKTAVVLILFLAWSLLPQARASMFTQIRYMTTDIVYSFWSNTQLQGFETIQNAQGYGYDYFQTTNATAYTRVQFGIRVYLGEWNETSGSLELTSGTPIAIVQRTSAGEGLQNATWTPPLTNLTRTQFMEVKIYYRRYVVSWGAWFFVSTSKIYFFSADFYSELLGMTQLLNATWNVYYYTAYKTAGSYKWFEYYWGDSDHNSRIENIQLDDGVEDSMPVGFGSGLLLGGLGIVVVCLVAVVVKKKRA